MSLPSTLLTQSDEKILYKEATLHILLPHLTTSLCTVYVVLLLMIQYVHALKLYRNNKESISQREFNLSSYINLSVSNQLTIIIFLIDMIL